MDRFFMYAGLLAPLIFFCVALLTITVLRNLHKRKKDKARGLFE